jgi:hypothetical protein
VENAETVPLHFTLELEGLREEGSLNGSKTYLESYMACNG